jgi:hypothetical protein
VNRLFFLIPFILVLAACTPSAVATQVPPFPQETYPPYTFGDPVESESHAMIAAESGLRASFQYTDPLILIKTEQMSYGEYSQFVGASLSRSSDLQVWLVIFYDHQWQVKSPPGTPPPPFQGCVSVAIDAVDGSPLEIGGPLPFGLITQCDG